MEQLLILMPIPAELFAIVALAFNEAAYEWDHPAAILYQWILVEIEAACLEWPTVKFIGRIIIQQQLQIHFNQLSLARPRGTR